jgi:[acyl-carrier-protein] S-malonyltransferase
MGKGWLDASPEARQVFQTADRVLGERLGCRLSELCFNGPAERLNRTDASQPAIYVTSVACWRGLLAANGKGDGEMRVAAAAGLSLGEYTALHLAGAFTFEEGLELVALRGRAMQDAAEAYPDQPSGMLALIGADEAVATAVCDGARGNDVLVAANFNAPGQVVLSGHAAALERAAATASVKGLRTAMLPVAGAFHSPLMAPAAERLSEALARTQMRELRYPVISNVTARPHAASEALTMAESIRQLLVQQLTSPVRWADSCSWMVGNCTGEYHEVAPGATLAGLLRRIDRSTKVTSHDQP